METDIPVGEFIANVRDYLDRISARGERFILVHGALPTAEIGPAHVGRPLAELPALLESLPHLSPREAQAFADDVCQARSTISTHRAKSPWES